MIEITMDEILEDLCYPGAPPGRWPVPDAPARPARPDWRTSPPMAEGSPANTAAV
jgi:hypothetical protein